MSALGGEARPEIRLASVVVAAGRHVWGELGGEAVVLDLRRGSYYGLNDVGTRIWQLLEKPRRVEEIRDALTGEYEVETARCEADLLELLGKLLERGLIEVRNE